MAGFRLTLKKLAKKYGVDIKGATYAQVVQEIVQDNVARASKKMGDLSNRRMKKAFADSIKNGIVDLPEYAIPNVTVRKGADDGKMITDTLRDTLTRGLRQAILENPNDTEKAIAQMQQSVKDTFNTYTTSHAKMIAVTEVRSSVDLSKAEYVKELIARNPNRLRVTKKWIHHDHLVKTPRPTHKAIDGEKALFNQPFSIGLMYPHDPSAPASEVIGCQCGYQVEVEEMATNEIYKELKANINRLGEIRVYKASASINPATGKPYQIGETKVRPDGSKWVKTGTFSWAKAGTKDAEEAQKKTDSDGDGKAEKKEIEGQSSKDAEDILSVYGEKGLYQLTKAGMYNLLLTHGVDDPKSMKWAEKVEKVKEIVKELQEGNGTKIKTEGKQEFTEEDYHILHNSDLMGDASSLENTTLHTRNGDVTLKFTEDGGLTDQTYDELMQKVDPIEGGHWGSAETTNGTALAVALVNAPDWKPINQMKNGQLAKYDQQLSDGMYAQSLIRGIGLRKFAQEKLKHPDMSRERIPNFYRGMTIDASQYEQLLAGEIDTIELTGCTAITSFEDVADHYASSSWTRSFGAGRRSIKLVIERDDYMDNSIGMFHPNTKGYAHGNRNIAFELLTGSPSFYIKSVQRGGDFNVDKSANAIAGWYDDNAQERYNLVKDVDGASIYDPNGYWKYTIKDANDRPIIQADQYHRFVRERSELKSKALAQDLNRRMADWEKQYCKDHIQDFFSKVKNGNVYHANNRNLRNAWNNDVQRAWEDSDLYKEWKMWKDYNPFIDPVDFERSELPDEAERAKIDSYYNNDEYVKREVKNCLNNPVSDLDLTWKSTAQEQFDRWREAQNSKKGTLTMKMFLDKRKPLEKSYKTQVDKTADEYKDFEDFYKWRNGVLLNGDRLADIENKLIDDFMKKHDIKQEELDWYSITRTDDKGRKSISRYNIPYRTPFKDIDQDNWKVLREELENIELNKPAVNYDGDIFTQYSTADEDNPYLTPDILKNPFYQKGKNGDFRNKRYEQLSNMRKNYENAKRENDIIDKYDIYNTPKSEIQAKYDESQNKYNDIKGAMNKYSADNWLRKQGWDFGNLTQAQVEIRDRLYKGSTYYLNQDEREDYDNFRKDLKEKNKEYQKLEKQREEEGALNGELVQALSIYNEYNDKLASMHKSSRPLEVHVVCGRGKKSMTAGADDQLEEDNGSDQ